MGTTADIFTRRRARARSKTDLARQREQQRHRVVRDLIDAVVGHPVTTMPLSVAAGMSTLSTPMPKREMIRHRGIC